MPIDSKIVSFLILIAIGMPSFAQTQDSYDYSSEFTWGVNKNTSGGLIGGFVFKKARKLNERLLETYGLEIMNVKHAQESRLSSGTGNFFIYGKSNYLYAFRFQYGRDLIIFKKAPQQGVEIKAVVAAGPTIGVLAPYYIERLIDNSFFATKHEQYDPNNPFHSYSRILGTGYLFEGIGDSKIKLGGNLKFGINFELGTVKSQVTGFEVGFLLDTYFSKVILVPTADNSAVFPTLYFNLFYGKRK